MSHMAFSATVELSNCVWLPTELRQVSAMGSSNVTTPTELFDKTMEKSPALRKILLERSAGSSLRYALQMFRMAYYSKKKPAQEIMMANMVQAVTDFIPELKNKVAAAVKAAVSMVHSERLIAIENIAVTGELPVVDTEIMAMTLSGTPGMVELLTAGDPTVFAKSIESLITEYVSFETQLRGMCRRN